MMPWVTALRRYQCGAEAGCAVLPGEDLYRTRVGLVRCRAHAPVPYATPAVVSRAPRVMKGEGPAPFVSVSQQAIDAMSQWGRKKKPVKQRQSEPYDGKARGAGE